MIKEIVGLGEGLVGRLLLYDARAARFEDHPLPPPTGLRLFTPLTASREGPGPGGEWPSRKSLDVDDHLFPHIRASLMGG